MADEMINSYVALDLETTGIGARHEKITEIGMVKVIDGETTDTYHTMVNPHREIPKRIVELTGITDDMVKDALGIEEILDEVLAFTEDLPLLGHQIIFDYGFLCTGRSEPETEIREIRGRYTETLPVSDAGGGKEESECRLRVLCGHPGYGTPGTFRCLCRPQSIPGTEKKVWQRTSGTLHCQNAPI